VEPSHGSGTSAASPLASAKRRTAARLNPLAVSAICYAPLAMRRAGPGRHRSSDPRVIRIEEETGEQSMEVTEIRAKIKQIISNVTNIPVAEIGDQASYVDELNLDSLSLLEIGVDIDYEFKLGVPEEEMQEIRTVQDAVDLVVERLKQKAGTERVA
jgi:acyl carrier protein